MSDELKATDSEADDIEVCLRIGGVVYTSVPVPSTELAVCEHCDLRELCMGNVGLEDFCRAVDNLEDDLFGHMHRFKKK